MRSRTVAFILIFSIFLTTSGFMIPNITKEVEMGRKKHTRGNKYTLPILFGALMIKSVIFPLAFKAMAVMSSIAVLISTLSLIISSIVGYIKMGSKTSTVKFVQKPYGSWAKDDNNSLKNYYTSGDYHLVASPNQWLSN